MGGRRSYSIKDVLGKSASVVAKETSLINSFKKKDVDGITRGSISLVSDYRDIAKIIKYSEILLVEIKDKYRLDELRVLKEINKIVRIDWAEKKRKGNLASNRIIDAAVIDSVSRVLKEKK